MYNNYSTSEQQNEGTEDTSDDFAKREKLQEKHYKLLGELQSMASELPIKFQQRFPYELLSNLSNCLLDDTIYQIVKGLKNIQHISEKNLFEKRQKAVESFRGMKLNLRKKHQEALSKGEMTSNEVKAAEEEFERFVAEETRKMDMRTVQDLDQIVSEQQVTLERAGVAGFYVTNNPTDIQIQMHLLSFILRVGKSQKS
ncbi:protein DGCR6-like protein [Leptotrombidium deliense]|uniref:Protein DGCR6-like protein n=1 Tax=Leptotrombidium deliense TaxID=299467 RepID=A0A443S685_9ACAR|nr:protein DGCR6-like protein [Leptotrombidium deliense]